VKTAAMDPKRLSHQKLGLLVLKHKTHAEIKLNIYMSENIGKNAIKKAER
jgi:hypothetical protein